MKEPHNEDNFKKFLLEMSMYQDQLLQSYRLIFISSQTILISIGMLLILSGEEPIRSLLAYIVLFCFGSIILLRLWSAITESRELDVSYCHMQLLKLERNEKGKYRELTDDERKKPFESFKNWQQYNQDAKRSKLKNYDEHLVHSTVRKKMNRLPYWYFIIWILGFVIWGIYYFYLS